MRDLVKIYEEMIAALEVELAAAATDGIKAGIESLLDGARKNLNAAKEG